MGKGDGKTGGPVKTAAELRAERLAASLRDNLQRRKQQARARARRAGEPDESSGLPAAKKHESDD